MTLRCLLNLWRFSELIDALAKDKNYTASRWYQRYRAFTTLLQQTSTFAEPATDGLVKQLWYERDNGIASIRQGVPSLAEYQQSLPLLRELTERIRQQPDEETYQYVGNALQQAKENGLLKRMYWSLRNRVFAAFSPENYTSTVDENAFNKAAEFLNQHFHLGLVLKWHTEFGHLNRGDMLTSEQHRCSNEKKKFQRR
ncbi:hypothetical protein ACRW29_26135, partial [Escherichia coli]